MSNYVKIQCTIQGVKKELMEEAFARMGLYVDYDVKEIPSRFRNENQRCDAVLKALFNGDTISRIGLCLKDSYDNSGNVSTDMMLSGEFINDMFKSKKEFIERFNLEYICVKIINQTMQLGFQVDLEEQIKNGERRLVMYRIA